jgi:hypothetical protein
MKLTDADVEKFHTFVFEHKSGCHLWRGPSTKKGYPKFFTLRFERYWADMVAWVIAGNEELPTGEKLKHTCHVINCVNPDHLDFTEEMKAVADLELIKDGNGGGSAPAAVLRPRRSWSGRS